MAIALTKLASELDGDGWSLVKMSGDPIVERDGSTYMCMLQGFNGVGDNVNQYAGHEIWPEVFKRVDGRSFRDSLHKSPCLWNMALLDKPTEGVVCSPDDVVRAVRATRERRKLEAQAWGEQKRAQEKQKRLQEERAEQQRKKQKTRESAADGA